MPEGPSLLIAKENLEIFTNKKIKQATGNAKIDMSVLRNKIITEWRTWGKQLFIFTKNGPVVRIHFLMFGSYSLDEHIKADRSIRLCLEMGKHKVYFYTCSVKLVEDPTETYDWTADVLSPEFSAANAKKKLKQMPDTMVCDALLNQTVFSGVGNIIKNEVLYRIKLHPESLVGKLPAAMLNKLVKEARVYSFDFLKWKRNYELKKHWLAHTKKECKRCNLSLHKKYCGTTKRRTFFCTNCQELYN